MSFKDQANFSLPIAYNKILQMFVITCLLKFRKTKQKSEAQLSLKKIAFSKCALKELFSKVACGLADSYRIFIYCAY